MQYNRNKFNIGDMITLIDTEYAGESFKVAGVLEQDLSDGIQYSYKLMDIKESGLGLLKMLIEEESMEPMKISEAPKNIFTECLNQYERSINPVISQPKLRIGDVVKFQNYDDIMVVNEISESNDGHYQYDVILPNDEDMVCRFDESVLSFISHDNNLEDYFTEDNESANISKVKFKEGDKIRITKGDDIDYIGEVKEVDKNDQYVVFLNEIHRYRLYSGSYLESVDYEAFMESKAFSDNLFLESGNAADDSECRKHLGLRIRGDYRQRDPRKPRLIIAIDKDDESHVPHFHVFKSENDFKLWENSISLAITDNKYYHHESHNNTLDESELDAVLRCFGQETSASPFSENVWQYLIYYWNMFNEGYDIDINTPIPNYSRLFSNNPDNIMSNAAIMEFATAEPVVNEYPVKKFDRNLPPDYHLIMEAEERKAKEMESVNENISSDDILDMEIEDQEDPYFEMAQVKWGFMSIKLAIYGKEGDGYPHFHFYKECAPEKGIPENKRKRGGCICIESANYFIHGTHKDTMEPKEIDGLIKFLKTKNKTFTSLTNWEYIIGQWNDNNPDSKQLPIDLPIPNYNSNMKSVQKDKNGTKVISENAALEDDILNSTIDDEETGMSESMSITDFLNLDIDEIL